MKTISQVAKLTGVSTRTLQYYDEIGLLKPSELTLVGYRRYDEHALQNLQQILFFRELDFPLKDIMKIILIIDQNQLSAGSPAWHAQNYSYNTSKGQRQKIGFAL